MASLNRNKWLKCMKRTIQNILTPLNILSFNLFLIRFGNERYSPWTYSKVKVCFCYISTTIALQRSCALLSYNFSNASCCSFICNLTLTFTIMSKSGDCTGQLIQFIWFFTVTYRIIHVMVMSHSWNGHRKKELKLQKWCFFMF